MLNTPDTQRSRTFSASRRHDCPADQCSSSKKSGGSARSSLGLPRGSMGVTRKGVLKGEVDKGCLCVGIAGDGGNKTCSETEFSRSRGKKKLFETTHSGYCVLII